MDSQPVVTTVACVTC